MSDPSKTQPGGIEPGRRLDSWKEIAAYLGRDVTTVQRWEKREGMPVHRHLHDKRGSVYVLTSELDAWLQSRRGTPEETGKALEAKNHPVTENSPVAIPVRWRQRFTIITVSALVLIASAAILARNRAGKSARPPIKSIAVLPLKNLSADPSQEYLADGMTEALIGHLARIHELRVISRTSVMRFKNPQESVAEIAKALGVDALVEGSVIREGNQVRVHAQLIRAATDEHIWAEEYQREDRSILMLQEDVARSIANQIEITLRPDESAALNQAQAVDPQTYEDYLKGRYYFNQRTEDSLAKSIDYFKRAIARDPGFALAYSGLADTFTLQGFRGGVPSKEALAEAKSAAIKAVELYPGLSDAHVSLAFIAETHEWDWSTAEREYKRSLDLSPGNAWAHHLYAGFLTYAGRLDEGVAEESRARELDPLSLPINNALAGRLLAAGRFEEASQQIRKTLELESNFAPAHQTAGWLYLHSGKKEEAIQEFQKALELSGADDTDLLVDLGFGYASSGDHQKAEQILTRLKELHRRQLAPSGSIAILYGALGDLNQAFVWLDKAFEERDPELTYVKVGRRFEPLRHDPRFRQFVLRIGLPA